MLKIIVILILLLISGCDTGANEVVKSLDSPNGTYTAVAFITDEGATTDYSPQVSILKKGEDLPNTPGNIFIGNKSRYIDICWKDDQTLIVSYDCSVRDLYKLEDKFNEINIIYEKKDYNKILSTKR